MKRLLSLTALLLLAVVSFAYDFEVDGIYYDFAGTEATVVSGANKYTGSVTIPASVNYGGDTYSVTNIGSYAFYDCSGLTSIIIPNSVTSIGWYAFFSCSGLTSITIPNSVTNIGSYAFSNTAWYNNLPDGLVYAGKVAYEYKGTMPTSTSITIKDGTCSITGSAFYCCTGLTSVTIPNSMTSIGAWAFYCCTGLTSIIIPNSVTSIGSYAFYSCSGLKSIYSYITSPTSSTGSNFDSSNYTNATLYVPKGTKALYQNTDGWKNFQNIVEFDASAVQEISGEEVKTKVTNCYSIDGKRLSQPQKGLNIIRMSDGTTRKIVSK